MYHYTSKYWFDNSVTVTLELAWSSLSQPAQVCSVLNPFVLVFLMTVQSPALASQLDFRYDSVSCGSKPRLRSVEGVIMSLPEIEYYLDIYHPLSSIKPSWAQFRIAID